MIDLRMNERSLGDLRDATIARIMLARQASLKHPVPAGSFSHLFSQHSSSSSHLGGFRRLYDKFHSGLCKRDPEWTPSCLGWDTHFSY